MTFFNSNPWTAATGGEPFVTPNQLTKVYEYTDQGTEINQQLWEVKHPNFRRDVDKAVIYLNGALIEENSWELQTIDGKDYAYIPYEAVPEQTVNPILQVLVFVNGFGQ